MTIQKSDGVNNGSLAWAMVILLSLTVLSGCSSVFKQQVLYEARQPGADDKRYVVRLVKEQNPLTGTVEEFPARPYDLSETRVRAMMSSMYRRFFKDPETFVPPDESGTLLGAIVGAAVATAFDSRPVEEKRRRKKMSGSYRPELREDGHPASMSKSRPVFTPEEINILAPEIARAFTELRRGEHMTLYTRAFGSKSADGLPWVESDDGTSVAIRFNEAGTFLGIPHGASVSWDYYKVSGLDFRGRSGQVYTYTSGDTVIPEKYDFLAVFPRKMHDTEYWKVQFPLE